LASLSRDVQQVPSSASSRSPRQNAPGVASVAVGRAVPRRVLMHRRLARDYETLPASSEAMIHIASIDNLAEHTTDETTPTWKGTYEDLKSTAGTRDALSVVV
jgi:hypothetical protein